MHPLAKLDHRYIWHPFTQMKDWLKSEPIIITGGSGAALQDVYGRGYFDANSSIWTNLHGHNHPRLNRALKNQLARIAHSSALGLANEPASVLAERLIKAAGGCRSTSTRGARAGGLTKVFYSDDGSTAMEAGLKMAYEYGRRALGLVRPGFLSLEGAYHGDTVGAVSLGHIDLFHRAYSSLLFKSARVMAPYCYRCPFNRARPERADARLYRKCHWECVDRVEASFDRQRRLGRPHACMVVEPLIQGAAGMIPQPSGWLARVAEIVRGHHALLLADEVMTGFGRTTPPPPQPPDTAPGGTGPALFACQQEGIVPDLMAVAKGLTGGYLPMAATLATTAVFNAFLGDYSEFKTFFHGHSYTANQLGAAVALESLKLLETPGSERARRRLAQTLQERLGLLWQSRHVGDIRQVGLIIGVELVEDWHKRSAYPLEARAGIRVCEAMARHGVLTRPIGNVIVLMPPYCTTPAQARRMVDVLADAIEEVLE